MTEHGNTTITFASLLFYLMLLVLPVPHVGIESNSCLYRRLPLVLSPPNSTQHSEAQKWVYPFFYLALKQYTGRWIRKMCVVNSAGVKPKLVHFCVILNLPQLRGCPRNKVFYARAGVRRNGYRWWDFIRHRYAFSIRFKHFSKWP